MVFSAAKKDIVKNPKNLDIRELEADLLPSALDEVAEFITDNCNGAVVPMK